MSRVQLWSCGGGRQSAGIAALIVQRKLPRPDHVCMVRLEAEVHGVWEYVNNVIRPALRRLDIPFVEIPRAEFATKGLWGGASGDTLLLPAFTNLSGSPSKLPEFCSGEWKRDVTMRWAATQPGWKKRGVDIWIGISVDESRRRRGPRRKWIQPAYPLLDVFPVTTKQCLDAVAELGWPPPVRSRCYWCPNQSDREWRNLSREEFERACDLDESIRETDPNAFLHRKLIPLRQVPLDQVGESSGGCSSGFCF